MKATRLFRVTSKLQTLRMIEESLDMYTSNTTTAIVRIVLMFLFVLWLGHIVCCIFYTIGRWGISDTSVTWLNIDVDNPSREYMNMQDPYLYATSFHWAVAQISLGSIDIDATNTPERILSVLLMLCGLVFSHERRPHHEDRAALSGRQQTPDTADDEESLDMYTSNTTTAIVRIVLMFLFVLWLGHIVCCIFYTMGRWGISDTGVTWLNIDVDNPSLEYINMEDLYLYATSFHWAVAQISLGSIDIDATNTPERILSVLLMLCGLVFNGTLVSSFSAILVGLEMEAREQTRKTSILSRFLRENEVPLQFSVEVMQMAEVRQMKPATLVERDVPVLNRLPASMLEQLRIEIYSQHAAKYILFELSCFSRLEFLRALCKAARFELLPGGDDLFFATQQSNQFYLLSKGDATYHQEPLTSLVATPVTVQVAEDAWLSEASLWVSWLHVGRTSCVGTCHFVSFKVDLVTAALHNDRFLQEVFVSIARGFHACIVSAVSPFWPNDLMVKGAEFYEIVSSLPGFCKRSPFPSPGCSIPAVVSAVSPFWPNDLMVKGAEFYEIVSSLPGDMRNSVVLLRIQQLKILKMATLKDLCDDVACGKSELSLTSSGDPRRCVLRLSLQLLRDDGYILAEVGFLDEGGVAKCSLPGLKRMPNEPAAVACSRLIHTKLPPLAASITVDSCSASTSEAVLQEFGICSCYQRTTLTAKVTGDIQAETCVSSLSAKDIRRSGVSVDADLFKDNLQREVYFVMGTDKTRLYVW
eukprot:CAMPEP_0194552532 /NCGR_PEP_ID=MMETSP0253-20130528/96772_1 /TAXON_ID=2966 /ORGANISM="Noctiluca scintillans" /LENGTH=755 /DNA_ID=CAMNT_0039400005 /DNA_START=110 /DNA_END=2374 /DNA_ORIENTATION=+